MVLTMKMYESQFPMMYSKALLFEKNYDLGEEHTKFVFEFSLVAIAKILNYIRKTKEKDDHKPVSFVISDIAKRFIAGAYITYVEGSDKNDPGNWQLSFTLNEEDMPKEGLAINLTDELTGPYIMAAALETCGLELKYADAGAVLITTLFEVLKKYLTENAKADQEVSIEEDNLFVASVTVDGSGNKVMTFEPSGDIKAMIKDDSSIEK